MSKGKTKKDLLEDYLYSEEFEYDIASDPVYKALKDQVSENAKKSAEDLLGKYSQISGGGSVSSAAMSAAAQGANSELSKLGVKIPELYELAREMYNDKLAEKERKFRAALDYESHLSSHPESEEFTDNEDDNGSDGGSEMPKPEQDSTPEDGRNENSYSKGDNGLTTGSLAVNGAVKHQMDKNVFDMTKNLIRTYLSTGQSNKARGIYSKFKNSMSDAQRLEVEKLFE